MACVRRRDRQPVDESLCDPQMEPDTTDACNVDPCPPVWVEGEWGPCSKHCGEGGEQSRGIKCEQVISGGIPTVVDDSQCLEKVGPKGPTKQECNKNVTCPQFHIGPWKPVRITCLIFPTWSFQCSLNGEIERKSCFYECNEKIGT